MSRKTRKLIWSVPLVATLAIVGALAAFIALAPNEAAAQTEEAVPGTPMNLTVGALSPTSIEVMWDPPTGGGTPDGYRIDFSEEGDVWYALESSYDSTVYTDDTDLSARETRHYRVFAFNSSGTSDVLGPKSATTDQSDAPDAPTSLVLSDTDPAPEVDDTPPQEGIKLEWDAPEDPEGAPVKSYRIQVSKDGRNFSNLEKTLSATDAACTGADDECEYIHDGLLESTERWYQVYASNSVGESDSSNSRSKSTTVGVPPVLVPAVRVGLNPAKKMVLYWDKPATEPDGAPITGYYILGGEVTSAADSVNSVGVSKNSLYPIGENTDVPLTTTTLGKFDGPEAADNELWSFRVMAVNRVVARNLQDGTFNVGDGAWSQSVQVNTFVTDNGDDLTDDLHQRPTLKAKRDTNVNGGRTSIKLSWKTRGSDDTTSYRLETSEDRTDWTEVDLTAGTSNDMVEEFPHIGLTAGTRYYYRVFATHRNSRVGSTDGVFTEASFTVAESTASADRPDAPTLETVQAASETSIQLNWTPPVAAGDPDTTMSVAGLEPIGFGKITGYLVESSANGTVWTRLVEVGPKLNVIYTWDGTELTTKDQAAADAVVDFVHKGLVQGQTVYYRVSTINNAPRSLSLSSPSDGRSDTTLRSLASDDPGGLVVKARSSMSLELLWNARADDITAAPVVGYKIESSPLNADDECAETWAVLVANTMTTTTSYTNTGLAAETGRCYRVFGINIVATSSGFVGFGDDYATTYDNDAIAITAAGSVVTVLTVPTNVMATADDADPGDIDVVVTWTPGENAVEGHVVLLFTSDFTAVPHTDVPTLDGMHTFMSVSPGSYVAVVVAIESRSNYLYDYDRVTVGQ